MNEESNLLVHAEEIVRLANSLGSELLVIGAVALAGHRYVRLTNGIDLGGNLSLGQLSTLADALTRSGHAVELREPGDQDPLGGVIDIKGNFGQVQIISFEGRFPAVIQDALEEPPIRVTEHSLLQIIPLPHLVVLKLYAGGFKSKADIVEVLSRNEEADLDAIAALCDRYRVRGFADIRQELHRP